MLTLIAFLKSIPALEKLISSFISLWREYERKQLTNQAEKDKEKRNAALERLKHADNSKDRLDVLRDLDSADGKSDSSKLQDKDATPDN